MLMRIFQSMRRIIRTMSELDHRLQLIQQSIGRIESRQVNHIAKNINDAEIKVFSQSGEDGIIQFLINKIPIEKTVFVEFGVENYKESNTRFLLMNNFWSGLVMDGSESNIQFIKNDSLYWSNNLKAVDAFITRENINSLLVQNCISGDIGLLSIDVDGNDYWIWEAITCIQPRIVICEYNSLFGYTAKVTTPYDPSFVRDKAHYSKVYYGASIAALADLSERKGYSLVGTNRAGNNVFFVRNDVAQNVLKITPKDAYRRMQYREFHDDQGRLTYDDFDTRLKKISDMPLYNLDKQKLMKISDIDNIFNS